MPTIEELKKAKAEQDSRTLHESVYSVAKRAESERRAPEFPARMTYAKYKGVTLSEAISLIIELGNCAVPNFALSPEEMQAYAKAVSWLLALPHTEIDDPMKGLIVTGATGTGKTLLVSLLWELSERLGVHRPFIDRDSGQRRMRPLLWNCSMHALDHVEDYSNNGSYQAIRYNVLHIGDLGTEPDTFLRYGTKSSLSDLICQRSDMGYRDYPIVATSNLPWDEMRQRYGDRAYSRLRGDLIEVRLLGKDHRTER